MTITNQLESLVARGRHPRNIKDQREITFGLAECSTSEDLHERLVKKGGVQTLATLLCTCNDSDSQQFAALAIANTASTQSLCREIAKLDDVLKRLVAYVASETSDPIGRQYCAMAIGNVLAEPDNLTPTVELGCISALIKMLQNCSDGRDIESGTYAAFAISNIATDSFYHEQIVDEGAIELLVSLACCDEEEARRYALTSLRGLAGTKSNRQKMLQKGILDPLVLLSTSYDDGIVREVSCILNCLSSEDENKEEIAYRAIATLISCLVSGDDYVERHSCCAIANLLENEDIHARFLEERGLSPLIALCSAFDKGCREEAIRGIANLSFNIEIIGALLEEDVLCPLVKAIDNDLCRFAASTIANMATHSPAIVKIVQSGVIRPLVSLISDCGHDVESRRFGALALTNITSCEAFHSIVIEAGAPEALSKLSYSSDVESKQFVAQTLANLSCNAANHRLVINNGGLQCIIALANEYRHDIHSHAVSAMWGFSAASSKLRKKLVDEGGLGPLCRLLPLSMNDPQLLRDITACLCNLSQENENKFELTRSGAVATLLHCMESVDLDIAHNACECLANLSQMRENQCFLANSSGVISTCAKVMRSRDHFIQRESGRLLANLASSSDTLAANIFVSNEVHVLLMSFLLSKDSTCQQIGSIGIGNLCTSDSNRGALVAAGVLEPLISLTRSSVKSEIDTRRFSMLAIANLATSFANHDEFVSQGTIPTLVSFSNADDVYLKDYAAFALVEISKNANMTEILADDGALQPVLSLLKKRNYCGCVERQLLPALRTLSFLDRNKLAMCNSESLKLILGCGNKCNSDELRLACCTIANLVELECNMESVISFGCVVLLIKAIKSDSKETQSESARALGNLAGNAIFCRLLLDYGVVQLLVSCYVGANIESRRMAAMALCNFSSKIESHPLLLEMNVLSLATSECRAALDLKQTSDHETLRFCILIIANLTGGNHSHSLAETLFDMLMDFTRHRDIKCREYAILALGNLCTNPDHVKRLIDVKCANALVAYSFPATAEESLNTQFQAIAGLHGLSKHAELRVPLMRDGGLEPLILSLRGVASGSQIEIQRESAAALKNMAIAKENKHLLSKSAALPSLKDLLKREDSVCRNHASSALANLAESSSNGIHDSLLSDSCLDILCKYVNDKDCHIETKRAISRCIALFAGNTQVHEQLLTLDVLRALNVLIGSTGDRYCKRFGMMAIANLAIDDSNHGHVLSNIGFENILLLVRSDDVETLRSLSFALHSFSKHEQNHDILKVASAADSLVLLLRCDDYDTAFQSCLAAKYLCTSEIWRKILADSNGFEALFLLVSKQNLELKRELAATLRNMTLSTDNKQKIMKVKDGVKIIAKLCRDSDPIVSHQACGALANIAENQENKISMVEQGIILHLQFAVLAINDVPTLRESMRSLANLSSANENASIILASGVLTLIIETLCHDDVLCNRYAALSLSNLSASSEDCRKKIVGEGGITPLLSLLQQQDDRLTQQYSMSSLANLASCFSLQSDLVVCVQSSLKQLKSTDLDLRANALNFVANLASNIESRPSVSGLPFIQSLIECLACKSSLVRKHTLDALRGLSTNSSIRDRIIACGGLNSLLLLVNADCIELRQKVLLTLCNLSMSGIMSDEAHTVLQKVDTHSLIEFLCNDILASHKTFGAMAIGNIASNLDIQSHLKDCGALERLIETSEPGDTDIESQRCMAFAICNLAVQPEHRASISSSGGLSTIMYLCYAKDPNDILFALSTLRALATSGELRREIFVEGVLHALLFALNNACVACKREISTILALLSLNYENKFDMASSDGFEEMFDSLLVSNDAHCISHLFRCIGSICEVNELHPLILRLFLQERLHPLTLNSDPKVVREVIRCYANLSCNIDTHTALMTPDITGNLITLCCNNDFDVRRLSTLTLSNLSTNKMNTTLGGNGLLCALVNIINERDTVDNIYERMCYACMAIGSTVSTDRCDESHVIEMELIPSLMQLLLVGDEQLNLCTTYLLDKLSRNEYSHTVLHSHCIISNLMTQIAVKESLRVRTYSIGIIRRLSENNLTDIGHLLLNETTQFLAESCDFENIELCRQIACCACHLARRNEARSTIMKNSLLMKSLYNLCELTDVEVCRFALGSIANIAEDERLSCVVSLQITVASLLSALKSDEVSIVREAIRLIANLLSSVDFQNVILKDGLVSIIRITSFHDDECVRNAGSSLRKLAANEASHGMLFSQDGVEAIMHLGGHDELQIRILSSAALRDISSNGRFQLAAKDCGVVTIAVNMLRQHDTELNVLAMGILRQLSIAMSLKRELLSNTILNVMQNSFEYSGANEALAFESASFIANLAEHAQNKVTLAQMKVLEHLVRLSKHDSERVKQSAAHGFALISSTPTNHDNFVGPILDALITLLQCQDSETCSHAAAAIANISTKNGIGAFIGNLGGIRPLVMLLKTPDRACRKNSCHALSRLTIVEENKVSVIRCDGIGILTQQCNLEQDNLSSLATAVLCNLSSCSSHEEEFAREDLIQVLRQLATGVCPFSSKNAIMTLCNLTSKCRARDYVARIVGTYEIIGLVNYCINIECRVNSIMLLCNLCSVEKHKVAVLAAEGIDCLENIAANTDDINLHRATLLALYNISASDDSHVTISRSSLMQYVRRSCQSCDVLCRRCALMILANISANDDSRHIAIRDGGLHVAIISLGGENESLQQFGLVCLANMSIDTHIQSQIVVQGGLTPIIKLSQYGETEETRDCALACLSNLCTNENIHSSLSNQDVLNVLGNVLRENHSVAALYALANLTSSDDSIFLHDIGGITEMAVSLISLAESRDTSVQCLVISAFRRMAIIPKNREVLFRQGILLTLTNANNSDRDVLREISSCLCGLSLSSNRRLDMAQVANLLFMECVQSKDVLTVRLGLGAIANVAKDSETHPLLIDVIGIIVPLLSHTETAIKQATVYVFSNLLTSSEVHPTFIRHDGVKNLVQLQTTVCQHCDCLVSLSLSKLSSSIDFVSCDGLKYLMVLIRSKDKITRTHAAIAVRNLSTKSLNESTFFDHGIPGVMVEILNEKGKDLDIFAASTLRSLSCNGRITVNFIDSGILHSIIRQVSNASIALKTHIAAILANLSEHVECQPVMISHAVVKAIGSLSAVIREDTLKDCARALANLSSTQKAQHAIYRQNGFKILSAISRSDCEACQRYVGIALRFMASSLEVQRTLLAESATIQLYLDISIHHSVIYQRSAAASFVLMSQTDEGRLLMRNDGTNAVLRLCCHADLLVQRDAVSAVANLASSSRTRQYVAIGGGVEIIRSVTAANNDTAFLRDATRTISNLAVDVIIRDKMISQEIPKLLSKLAKSADSETQRFASLALCNLCVGTKQQKESIMKQGVLRVLHFILRYPDLEVERRASLAISALSLGSWRNKLQILEGGFVRSLLEAASYPDSKLHHFALLALCGLVLSKDPKSKHFFVEENGLPALISALESCTHDDSVHACIFLFGSLAEDTDILKVIVRLENFFLLIVEKFDGTSSIETKRSIAYLLALLSGHQDCHSRLKEVSALESVVTLISLVDDECQYYGAFALAFLARNKSFQVPLAKMGGIRPLVSIMAKKHSAARHWAALALLKLADNFETHTMLAEEGGIQALLQLGGGEGAGVTVANLATKAFDDVKQKWRKL